MTTTEGILGVTDDDDAFFELNPKDVDDVRRLSVRKSQLTPAFVILCFFDSFVLQNISIS